MACTVIAVMPAKTSPAAPTLQPKSRLSLVSSPAMPNEPAINSDSTAFAMSATNNAAVSWA